MSALIRSSGYRQQATGAETRTQKGKLQDIGPSVLDFFVAGEADETGMLQRALDSNQVCILTPGRHVISADLVVDPARNRNCGFTSWVAASRYPYTTQPGGPAWDGEQEAVIVYDGVVSSSACVIRASAEAVGVEPVATFENTIWGFTLDNVTLDANSKAGFGLYCARVQDLQLHHPRARGATVAGISINGTYSGAIRSPRCYLNPGRGFELGAADDRWGWTAQDKVNALYIYDIHCDANGSDSTFRQSDATLRKSNCGVYFGPHRGVQIFGIVSENNFGANVVFEPTSANNSIQGLYTELGCKYAPGGAGTDAISLGYATDQIGLMFIGAAAATHNRIETFASATDKIYITGTEPTAAREEGGFELQNVALAGGVIADWGNYRLVNCAQELENGITGTRPNGALRVVGRVQDSIGGLCAAGSFDASTGAIVLNGTPANCTIAYAGVGLYDVSIINDMANTEYVVVCSPGASNRVVGITSKTVGSFRISLTVQTTGAATDLSSALSFMVIGKAA